MTRLFERYSEVLRHASQQNNQEKTQTCFSEKIEKPKENKNSDIRTKEDKYTMDPGQSSLSQHKEKNFWSKMIFEQKTNKKNA